MGNEALIPHISDTYDSGIDSDEGKNPIVNVVIREEGKTICYKGSVPYEKLGESSKEVENSKRMTNVKPSYEKWTTFESDGSDSPQLYEVELTASDEDDSSVLELVIPMQSKIKRYHWLLEFLCYGCLYHYE